MQQLLKRAAGGACVAAALAFGIGSGLAIITAKAILLVHVAALGIAATLAGVGADLMTGAPKGGDEVEGIAKSVWATREHLEQFDIIEG